MFIPEEDVQEDCTFPAPKGLEINGRIDVLKNNIIYELKYVSELQHTHFLQLACYLVSMNTPYGILWNTKNNQMWKVSVPDIGTFEKQVISTITKRNYQI